MAHHNPDPCSESLIVEIAERGLFRFEKQPPFLGLSNPQKITCIIFENLFGPYFLPHQSHSFGYAPSSGENLTTKIQFKSEANYYFRITQ